MEDSTQYYDQQQEEEQKDDFYEKARQGDDKNNQTFDFNSIKGSEKYNLYSTSTEKDDVRALNINNDFPYSNVNLIPEIKIKNENYFKSGEKIETYFEAINNFKRSDEFDENFDERFNRCNSCDTENNSFFCETCRINLCHNCSENCKNNNHILIDLINSENAIKEEKKQITNKLIEILKGKKVIVKEKSPRAYNISNSEISENKSEIREDINKFEKQNDFELIERIISKNYVNYFHYTNISECNKYLENRYIACLNKNCLVINYDVDKWRNQNENLIEEEREEEIRIFGEDFIKKNRNNIFIIINNKKYENLELISNVRIIDNYLEVILVENLEMTDLSCMFNGCKYLKDFSKYKRNKVLDFDNVKDISYMFYGCTEIESLNIELFSPFKSIESMENLFCECRKLTEIIGFEKFKTKNVKSMAGMFNGCENLITISGIEIEFKTNKVTNFDDMFCNCQKLKTIPGIENWNMAHAKSLEGMFKDCIYLTNLPDNVNWDLKNVKSMKEMFSGCASLTLLPNFSNINFNNLKNMNEMFRGCENLRLKKKKKISAWKIKNKGKVSQSRIFANT